MLQLVGKNKYNFSHIVPLLFVIIQNLIHKQPHPVQYNARPASVNNYSQFTRSNSLRKHNPFVTDGGLLSDSAPVAVLILHLHMEHFNSLAKRDVLLQHHAVEGLRLVKLDFHPGRCHGVIGGPIGVIVAVNE